MASPETSSRKWDFRRLERTLSVTCSISHLSALCPARSSADCSIRLPWGARPRCTGNVSTAYGAAPACHANTTRATSSFSRKSLQSGSSLTGHCTRWAQIGSLDLRSLDKLPTELISRTLKRRVPDLIWKVPYKNSDHDLILLIEFQSKIDPDMAARVQEYTTLAREELLRQTPDRIPLFLALVIYNGTTPWPSAGFPDSMLPAPDLQLEAAQAGSSTTTCLTCRGSEPKTCQSRM